MAGYRLYFITNADGRLLIECCEGSPSPVSAGSSSTGTSSAKATKAAAIAVTAAAITSSAPVTTPASSHQVAEKKEDKADVAGSCEEEKNKQ